MLYVQKMIALGKRYEILDSSEETYHFWQIELVWPIEINNILIVIIWSNLSVVSCSNYVKIPKEANIQTVQLYYPKFAITTEFQVGEMLESIFFPSILG